MAIIVEWHKINGLVLDRDGQLWSRYRRGWHWHGPVEDPNVPAELESAAAELLDLWADAFDDQAEQEWSYQCSTRPMTSY